MAKSEKVLFHPRVFFMPAFRDERMFRGICQFAREAGWILDSQFYSMGILPEKWRGDGILCLLPPIFKKQTALVAFLNRHRHLPAVDLAMNDPSVPIPRVLQDNFSIGQRGAEHLIQRGLRRLGFVSEERQSHAHQKRFQGFQSACKQFGLGYTRIKLTSDVMTEGAVPTAFKKMVMAESTPVGLMGACDQLMYWIPEACQILGLHIPEQVSYLGVDNYPEICELAPVGITSIDNNTIRQGYEGAKLLHSLFQGEPPPDAPLIIPAGPIHVRASTDILATQHKHVATALRRIEAHFTDPTLSATSLSKGIPMSARRLHDAFLKYVGKTMAEVIRQRRLNHALQLLQKSDNKLWKIAEESGFSSAEVMSRTFQRILDHPPSHFRRTS